MQISILSFTIPEIEPNNSQLLRDQGIPEDAKLNGKVLSVMEESLVIFRKTADPKRITAEISKEEFAQLVEGEGKNELDATIYKAYSQSDRLMMFALTIGKEISEHIQQLFDTNDFALAYMLDKTASLAADNAVRLLEKQFKSYLQSSNDFSNDSAVLGYSPGYCGWDITGQIKFFDYLEPGKIGVVLNESCLMIPLKSVTGVLVAAHKDAHYVEEGTFSYCSNCAVVSCKDRMDEIFVK
ncbi:vitamin B12 dependent-methionine synthase activation domain-containing protein [candidate division KSB1 bacterium]